MILYDLDQAILKARERADSSGEAQCVVSGTVKGVPACAIYPLAGFGLPAGATLEEVIHPSRERTTVEPPEKTSTNGF
jgi:hypothetical protein